MGDLWALLREAALLDYRWEATRGDPDRLAMRAAWDVAGCQPGDQWKPVRWEHPDPAALLGDAPPPDVQVDAALDELRARFAGCAATCLSRDVDEDSPLGHMEFRGACLGCGWVADAAWPILEAPTRDHGGGENHAVEDALDHAFPGWRDLPVVQVPPSGDIGPAHAKAVAAWRAKVDPALPPGWIDRGGPIRTRRSAYGTRHVPGRTVGVPGYDVCANEHECWAGREAPRPELAMQGALF